LVGTGVQLKLRKYPNAYIAIKGLKQVMSLFTLGSTRAVLVVALAYSFPDVFNVIMALISPYTNQPFIVPIQWTRNNFSVRGNVSWLFIPNKYPTLLK
jgi:hypothetical protein